MERVNPDLNASSPVIRSFLALTVLLSLIPGEQDRSGSRQAAGSTLHAVNRAVADEHASSNEPVPSNKGFEKPSHQPQQESRSSSHRPARAFEPVMAQGSTGRPQAACSSDPHAGPRRPGRPPGGVAPTSEMYFLNSVHYLRLQTLWHECKSPDEAAIRV